jgi:hypothetical protein
MNKKESIDFVITSFDNYAKLHGSDVSNFCNTIRDTILENIGYVLNKIEYIKDQIIEKYNPNLFILSDYLEHIFHKKLLTILKEATILVPTPNFMFYLIVYTCIVKYKLTLVLEKMIENNNEKPELNLINTRKLDNLELISNVYQTLVNTFPNSEETMETKNLIINNGNLLNL